jgi:hypothetical protein
MKKIILTICSLLTINTVTSALCSSTIITLDTKNNPIEERTEQKVISIVDDFSYQLDDNTAWKIINTKDNSIFKTGIGSIKNVTFAETTIYDVEIIESPSHDECNHQHFPTKISIQVSPLKMEFDFSTIKFTNEIVGGQSQDGNFLTIDVVFSNINNESTEFTNAEFTSAGVGVNIKGSLVNEKKILTPGLNHLVYKLTGVATSQTHIMFDFYDINKQIVSYYHPTKIN